MFCLYGAGRIYLSSMQVARWIIYETRLTRFIFFFFFFWNWKRCNISRTLIGPQKEYTVYEFVVQIQLN